MSGRIFLEVGGKRIKKIYSKTANGEVEIKKAYSYPGNRNVFSSGHVVVYHIDTNNVVNKEVDDGADCITNAPSAAKSGWTFHGWREDAVASSTTIQSKICNADNIHLYAVFKKSVTVTYNGNGATGGGTSSQTDYKYYNNGNSTNASFTLRSNGYTRSGCTSIGKWAIGSVSGTQYSVGASVTLDSDTIFYAKWKYNDVTLSSLVRHESNGEAHPNTMTLIWGVDTSKYSYITAHVAYSMSCNYKDRAWTAYATCGGGSTDFASCSTDHPTSGETDITIWLSQSSGTSNLNSSIRANLEDEGTGGWSFWYTNIVGHGRTV